MHNQKGGHEGRRCDAIQQYTDLMLMKCKARTYQSHDHALRPRERERETQTKFCHYVQTLDHMFCHYWFDRQIACLQCMPLRHSAF